MYTFSNMCELYQIKNGNDIFNDIVIDKRIEKEILLSDIHEVCDDLKPLEKNTEILKKRIDVFFRKNLYNIGKILDVYMVEYNPIENYDSMETIEINRKETDVTVNETDFENKTSAYNVTDYQPNSKDNSSGTTDNENTIKEEHNNRRHGNIGVTTTMQLIKEEIDLRKFDIYNYITTLFCKEFCLQVF